LILLIGNDTVRVGLGMLKRWPWWMRYKRCSSWTCCHPGISYNPTNLRVM